MTLYGRDEYSWHPSAHYEQIIYVIPGLKSLLKGSSLLEPDKKEIGVILIPFDPSLCMNQIIKMERIFLLARDLDPTRN